MMRYKLFHLLEPTPSLNQPTKNQNLHHNKKSPPHNLSHLTSHKLITQHKNNQNNNIIHGTENSKPNLSLKHYIIHN